MGFFHSGLPTHTAAVFQATETLNDAELAEQFPVLSDRMNTARAAVVAIPASPVTLSFLSLTAAPGDLFGRVLTVPVLVEHVHTPHCKLDCALRFAPHTCSACNHTQSKTGAVYKAAIYGDVPGLHAALAAGGSTEEVDKVRATVGDTECFGSRCI